MKTVQLKSILPLLVFLNYTCENNSHAQQVQSESNQTVVVYEKEFKDDFENGIQDFWVPEVTEANRYEIVEDPINKGNKVLKVNLQLDDFANGGRRSEILIRETIELDYFTEYKFRFLIPEDFFRADEKDGIIIIHQWHDEADPGFNWETQKKVTHPPIYLFMDRKDGKYQLVFRTGLESGTMNETVTSVWNEPIQPNKWYEFSCEVLWHIYTKTGYATPKLDGKYFYNPTDETADAHKIYRRNMYNGIGNYPKIGLYKFGNELYERNIYFDDFELKYGKMPCN